MQNLNEKWHNILEEIPEADREGKLFFEAVAGDKFKKFGEFGIVNTLAKSFNYTHSEVFELSWRLAYTIVAYEKTQAYVSWQSEENRNQANSAKN